MKFFEQFGKKVSDAGSNVALQTKNLAETTRISSLIYAEERNIENKYVELGKAYYEKHKSDASAEFFVAINYINETFSKIKQYREQIDSIKGIMKCPHCGKNVSKDALFCNNCGEKLVKKNDESLTIPVQNTETEEERFCPSCGAKIDKGNQFCTQCGHKLFEDTDKEK